MNNMYALTLSEKINIDKTAISKIPYVKYPGICKKDCALIRDLAREVLYISMTENNSNEVEITFSLDYKNMKSKGETYKAITKGDEYEINIGKNKAARYLWRTQEKNSLVSLHNHPTPNGISISDVMAFLKESAIGYMIVITNAGELYYMYKDEKKYNSEFADFVLNRAFEDVDPEYYNNNTTLHSSHYSRKQKIDILKRFFLRSTEAGVLCGFNPHDITLE